MTNRGTLQPLLAGEQDAAYALYRQAMMAGLRRVAHWDEALQRQRFLLSYRAASLYWYQEHGRPLALLSFSRDEDGLVVHLLVVTVRRCGSGRRAMQLLHGLCPPGRQVRLSCLRHDRAVQAFYAALGYHIHHAGTDFLELHWRAAA